jgi:two-component system NtrC family sensor kinase
MTGPTLVSARNSRRRRREEEIRLVIVEDVPTDAELMIRILRQAGLRIVHRVVVDETDFRRSLADFRPQVVLADYNLPRFSGRRALRIARRFDPLLPVIMVTGSLREESIVRLTSLGLTNYVLKDHLLRLAPAVLDALDRAEEKRSAVRSINALEHSELRFRAVAEASGDALLIVDDGARVVFGNAAAERMFGIHGDELVGADVSVLIPARDRERLDRGWSAKGRGQSVTTPFTIEVCGLRADGSEFPVELTVSSWHEEDRRLFSAQIRDITVRKEEARTRKVLSQAVEQALTLVVITDVNGIIQYVNPAFERITGYPAHEVIGQTPRILNSGMQPPEVYAQLWAEITAGGTFIREMTNRRKDGGEYVQRSTIFPIVGEDGRVERYMGLGQDVTQERLLERQLRQSQKMEAVGQLAGGIAHDFNNILTGVLTNAQLLEFSLAEGHPEEMEGLKDIIGAARRGADLVKRLMSLARADVGSSPGRVDVRAVVREAIRTVRRILPETIAVVVDEMHDELPCVVDEGELNQALMNLATNARDAMPEGGSLAIRARLADGSVVIEVRDNGTGMAPGVVDRIFEPFFTTKDVGKGTGLGLAMVYGFADRAGGTVTAESRMGAGTVVRLTLPLAPDTSEEAPTGSLPEAVSLGGAGGTVLLAEDQEDICRVAKKVLERLGYRVLTASDGVEAMGILARERGKLDLVLADLVMPRGGGGMLFRNSRDWPDRPRFLLMSGYAAGELNGDGHLLETVPFLAKPWSVADLEAAVAGVMSEGTP